MAQLRAMLGVDMGRDFPVSTNVTRLGRHPDNDVVLRDEAVSRFHAEITCVRGEFNIRDLGSSSGTLVNYVYVQATDRTSVKDGDRIRMGMTELLFHAGEETASQPSPPSPTSAELPVVTFPIKSATNRVAGNS